MYMGQDKGQKERASVPRQSKDGAIHGAITGQGHEHWHCNGEVS